MPKLEHHEMLLSQALGNVKKWATLYQRIVLLMTEWKLLAFRQMATSGWFKTMHFNKTDHRSLNMWRASYSINYVPHVCYWLPEVSGTSSTLGLKSWVSSSIIRKGSTRVATRDGWEVVRWKLHVKNENGEKNLLVIGWMPCLQHPYTHHQPTHTVYRRALLSLATAHFCLLTVQQSRHFITSPE